MQSIFDKIQDKLADVKGNVMAFGDRPELKDKDEPTINGICDLCKNIVFIGQLENNNGICDKCCLRDIL